MAGKLDKLLLREIALPQKDKAEKFDSMHKEFIEFCSKYEKIAVSDHAIEVRKDQIIELLKQLCDDFFEIIFGYKMNEIKQTIGHPDITPDSHRKSYIHYKNLIKKGYNEAEARYKAKSERSVKMPKTDLNKKTRMEMDRLKEEGIDALDAARKVFYRYFASELDYANYAVMEVELGKKAYDKIESDRLEKIGKKIESLRLNKSISK
jgi:hypothetical protein